MASHVTTLKSKSGGTTWINVINAQKKEIAELRRKFKFDDLDLRDSYGNHYAQRPKFYLRAGYCFLLLQFPVYNTKTRAIESEEVDFFIGDNYIITSHTHRLPPMIELYNLCHSDKFYRDQYLSGTTSQFLYEIISRLQEYCYPMLDHISLDIRNIEKNIFVGRERRMVNEILSIKRNVLSFRKSISAHKSVIKKIMIENAVYLPMDGTTSRYQHLVEHTKNIWEILDGQKEMIEALEDTNTTLVSFKLNDIMRTLTIFSVIVFPLTLLAAVFGMNTVVSMPFVDSHFGFWYIIGMMAVGSLVMYAFFRRKRWI